MTVSVRVMRITPEKYVCTGLPFSLIQMFDPRLQSMPVQTMLYVTTVSCWVAEVIVDGEVLAAVIVGVPACVSV